MANEKKLKELERIAEALDLMQKHNIGGLGMLEEATNLERMKEEVAQRATEARGPSAAEVASARALLRALVAFDCSNFAPGLRPPVVTYTVEKTLKKWADNWEVKL